MSNFSIQTTTYLVLASTAFFVALALTLVFVLAIRIASATSRANLETKSPDPTDPNQVLVAGGASGLSHIVIDDEMRPLIERRNELRRRLVIRTVQEETSNLEKALGAQIIADNTKKEAA